MNSLIRSKQRPRENAAPAIYPASALLHKSQILRECLSVPLGQESTLWPKESTCNGAGAASIRESRCPHSQDENLLSRQK